MAMTRFLPAVECIPKVAAQRSFGILSPIFGGAEVQNDLRQEFPGTPATDPQPSEPGTLEVSNVGGITVVTEDTKSPVATVAAIIGAGTRDEPVRAPGVARMLKQMAFKKSTNRSALRFDREFVDVGANVNTELTREQTILKASVLKQYSTRATELLGDTVSNPEFVHWEIDEYRKYAENEVKNAREDLTNYSTDGIHAAAFYDTETLGKPLYGDLNVSVDSVSDFYKASVFAGNVTVVGAGINHQQMVEDVQNFFNLPSGTSSRGSATYVGGEIRQTVGQSTDITIAFPVSPSDAAAVEVAATILGRGSLFLRNEKCGYGGAGRLNADAIIGQDRIHEMEAISAIYSDAGLFGIRAHTLGAGDDSVVESIAAQFHQLVAGVTDEECKRAVNAIKGRLLTSKDNHDGQLRAIINAITQTGTVGPNSTAEAFAAVDSVTASQVQSVVANAIKNNPSVSVAGDVASVSRHNSIASHF